MHNLIINTLFHCYTIYTIVHIAAINVTFVIQSVRMKKKVSLNTLQLHLMLAESFHVLYIKSTFVLLGVQQQHYPFLWYRNFYFFNFNTIFTVILHLTHLNVNVFFFWMWPWSRITFEWWVHVLFIERKTDISSLGQFAFYPAAHQSYLNDEHFEDPYRVAKWQDSNPHMHPTHHTRAHTDTQWPHTKTQTI